ncbi:DNA polymerase domain-containing protein [Nanoarchaeota archaeon]
MKLIDMFVVDGKLLAWLYDGENHFIEVDFSPRIYVYSSFKELLKLKRVLCSYGLDSFFEKKKTLKGIKTVLRITSSVGKIGKLVRDIEKFGNYSYEIFNSDVTLAEYYLFENHLFPNCEVEVKVEGGKVVSMVARESVAQEYSLPNLKICSLSVETSYTLRKDLNAELISIEFDGRKYLKSEISSFVRDFGLVDPDLILTEDGNVELPFLLREIRKVDPKFSFSRFGEDNFKIEGKSYFSYGQMFYKFNAVYLRGRLHMKRAGTLYGSWSLWYPFELARRCRVTLQRMNARSVGYGVSNLQLYYAMEKGFLIPRKSSCVEVWKSGFDLFEADRGALTYEPEIGYHDNVAEIDFISLFPSIMVKFNISTETLFCKCCRDNKVPGLGINICRKDKGIMGEMLDPLIRQRLYYKSTGKKNHKERADALKGLLVCSFGYMGFKKSKFARIESHQSIQAYAREVLLESSKIAEQHGFRVLHGIVDSLWVKKANIKKEEVQALMDDIYALLGLQTSMEGIYRWIVFLPSTNNSKIPVPTRYYGVFDNGEVKCRGIEVRRHDSPEIIKKLQYEIIYELANATNFREFVQRMRGSIKYVKDTINRIVKGDVAEDEIVITKGISKLEYSSNVAQSVVLNKLKKKGFSPQPGQYLRYVITHKNSPFPANRYSDELLKYDRVEYVRLARMAVSNLFQPFVKIVENQFTLYDTPGVKVKGLPLQIAEKTI